jgi:hypothetical protein
MIDNRTELFARASEPRQTLGYDEIATAFAESLEPLRQLANLPMLMPSRCPQTGAGRWSAWGCVQSIF